MGSYEYLWSGVDMDGNSVPSGVYYVRVNLGQMFAVHKILLIK